MRAVVRQRQRILAACKTTQILGEVLCRVVALHRILGHRGQKHRVEGLSRVWVGVELPRRPRRLVLNVLVSDRKRGFAGERRGARDGLEKYAADSVDIGTGVGGLTARLLRREVLRGTQHRRSLRHRGGITERASDAEVHHLHLAGVGQHDVRRLDVTVNDAGMVGCRQCVTHRCHYRRGFLRIEPPLTTNNVTQRLTLNQLHDNERHAPHRAIRLAGVIHRHDRRVIQ